MADGDIVRRITISATGENIDSTKSSVEALGAATAALQTLTAQSAARAAEASKAYNQQVDSLAEYNSSSRATGIEVASLTNHLRQAAEAAYAFSPAFRGIVNSAAAASIGYIGNAASLAAAGIRATGETAIVAASRVATLGPAFEPVATAIASAGVAMAGFTIQSTALGVATSALVRGLSFAFDAFKLFAPIGLLIDGVKLIGEAWRLGGEELQKYVEIGRNAGSVSVEFSQRIAKAAADAKIPLDDLTKAFKNLEDATADKLGGSAATNRLKELTDAGNFKGNTGVSAFLNADGVEAKSRAAVSLFEQALQSGQRLAALDFAKTIWGEDAAKNLAKNQDYMRNILASADAISSKQLVSQLDVDRAVALQNRYDAAVAILEQRWHPIQDVLTTLGMKMREVWIDIVSQIASAVDYVFKLGQAIADKIPASFWAIAQKGLVGGLAVGVGTVPGIGPALSAGLQYYNSRGDNSNQPVDPMEAARANLAAQLGNPANVAAAKSDAVSTAYRVRKDLSIDTSKTQVSSDSAIDRATDSLNKYIKTTNAAAESVGSTADQVERLKANALLEAAAEKDGVAITAARADAFTKLAQRAGDAALALEKAKVANDIKFNRQTALLSPEDVQIASQLRNIYPNVADALKSVEAQGIRANNTLREINDAGRSVAQGIGSDLLNQLRNGAGAWDAFKTAGLNALNHIADKLMQMAVDSLWTKAFSGLLTGGFSFALPGFAAGTDYAPGGLAIVGEEGPELVNLPKGSSVTPNRQTMAALSGGGGTNVPIQISIDAKGADSSGLARVTSELARLRADLPATVVSEVRKAKSARML